MRNSYFLFAMLLILSLVSVVVGAQDDGAITPPGSIGLELVAEGMAAPIDLEQPADGSGRLFVADQTGQIYVIDGSGQLLDTPLLDISGRMVQLTESYDERGLLCWGWRFTPTSKRTGVSSYTTVHRSAKMPRKGGTIPRTSRNLPCLLTT